MFLIKICILRICRQIQPYREERFKMYCKLNSSSTIVTVGQRGAELIGLGSPLSNFHNVSMCCGIDCHIGFSRSYSGACSQIRDVVLMNVCIFGSGKPRGVGISE
jgi:hypothetical protein